jgi:hypothetical protein
MEADKSDVEIAEVFGMTDGHVRDLYADGMEEFGLRLLEN